MQEIGLPYRPVVTPRRPADSGTLPKRVRNKFGILKKPTHWPKPKHKKMTRKRPRPKSKPEKVIDLDKLDQPENPSSTPEKKIKSDKNSSDQSEPGKNVSVEDV